MSVGIQEVFLPLRNPNRLVSQTSRYDQGEGGGSFLVIKKESEWKRGLGARARGDFMQTCRARASVWPEAHTSCGLLEEQRQASGRALFILSCINVISRECRVRTKLVPGLPSSLPVLRLKKSFERIAEEASSPEACRNFAQPSSRSLSNQARELAVKVMELFRP
ncbi:hypothetical protein M5K25_005425 [Dendrobium thyrsiflorum]|uniref:Uncharacterized protein n=1 Tax=Dendrobium thyrsiflorum TaxID=117978 RepID=A0ABD0VPZ0_DENTH